MSQLNLMVEKRNDRIDRQNRTGDEETAGEGKPSQGLNWNKLKAAQQERFEVWQQMHGKRGA